MDNKPQELPDDGTIRWRDSHYRVHKAWSTSPIVFVRYTTQPTRRNPHGRHVERRLLRDSDIAMHVVIKFRNTVRKGLPLVPEAEAW